MKNEKKIFLNTAEETAMARVTLVGVALKAIGEGLSPSVVATVL